MSDVPKFDDLQGGLRALSRLPLSKRAKKLLQDMLAEASTPDRHGVDRLEPDHAENIRAAIAQYTDKTNEVIARANRGMAQISREEFAAMVEEANRELDRTEQGGDE